MTKDWAAEYLTNWVAPDGGGKLKPSDIHEPFPGCSLETTNNENPILFLVQSAMELIKHYPASIFSFKALYEKHMASTVVEGIEGLHSRRCGDFTIRRQSHDNVVAMLIGGWYFKSDYAMKIYKYGSSVGWNYAVMTPGQFDMKSQIQGGDVAIAHYAVGFSPEIWNVIWLAVGLAISKTWNLADIRIQFLQAAKDKIPLVHKLILGPAIFIHQLRRGPRVNWVKKYFGGTEYPFRMVIEESLSK